MKELPRSFCPFWQLVHKMIRSCSRMCNSRCSQFVVAGMATMYEVSQSVSNCWGLVPLIAQSSCSGAFAVCLFSSTYEASLLSIHCAFMMYLGSYGAGEYFVGVVSRHIPSRFSLRVSAASPVDEVSTHMRTATAIVDNLAIMSRMDPHVRADALRSQSADAP